MSFDLDLHKGWVITLINSCVNNEQLDSCKVLIALLGVKLREKGYRVQEIRMVEDELLIAYYTRESQIAVP